MTKKEKYIQELEQLNSFTEISVSEIKKLSGEFEFGAIEYYLHCLINKVKPETASAELLKSIVKEILDKIAFSEQKVKDGFIDLAIQETVVNPILIELKPNFFFNQEKECLKSHPLSYQHHKTQIQKYLIANDYIVLTDLKTAFIFGRESLINYEPFTQISFTELLKSVLHYNSFWGTIRRLDDKIEKPELEKEFFEDLKKWYDELDKIKFDQPNGLEKQELIVLLMNKIIFIKTLEDYGLIPYKKLETKYFQLYDEWATKGLLKFFTEFFTETEKWFFDFYDTELFKVNVWNYIKKDENNLKKFKSVYERVLGTGEWEYTFNKGLIHYNYRQIDEDVFGKAYETFIAEDKKDSGIYYTPKLITKYMSLKITKSLFEPIINQIKECINKADYKAAASFLQELRKIKIVDTSSGSGSFLIKVLREIYNYYEQIDQLSDTVNKSNSSDIFNVPQYVSDGIEFRKKAHFNDKRQLIGSIVLHHICAIDIDERALETAKTNIWKEAVKLHPQIFAYKKLPPEANHVLPNLELNFLCADALFDLPLDEQINFIAAHYSEQITQLQKIRNQYLENPYHPAPIDKAKDIKKEIRKKLTENLPKLTKPTFITLEFFYLFFDEKGIPLSLADRGFSGVISNPPWEAIKPIKKEFAKIRKSEMDVKDFDKWFNTQLKQDKKFKENWDAYEKHYENYNEFLHQRYIYQSIGDSNFYKLLLERNIEIVKPNGYVNILIPSGIQTDAGSDKLRKLLLEKLTLTELSSFENRGYKAEVEVKEKIKNLFPNAEKIFKTVKLFPDVDNRFKFSALFIHNKPTPKNHSFDSRFYLHDPAELDHPPLKYDVEMIKKFSPENFSIMEFESEKDYQLCAKIRGEHQLLMEQDFKLRAEFHMTNNSGLFITEADYSKLKNKKEYLPLFEGKMIHQFKSNFGYQKYYLKEKDAHSVLLGKEISRIKKTSDKHFETEKLIKDFEKQKLNLDYQNYRLVYRAIAGSTNERTIISTVLPKNVFAGNSLHHLVFVNHYLNEKKTEEEYIGHDSQVYLMSMLNSLTLNYYIRNKISANLSMTFMYELPFPLVKDIQLYKQIVELGFNLLYHSSNAKLYGALAKELKIKTTKNFDAVKTRAALEVLIAKELYGITKEEWKYLTSTFVYGDASETKKELDEIIKESIKIF